MRLLLGIMVLLAAAGCAAKQQSEQLAPVVIPPRGAAQASVTVHQFSDFQCRPCAEAAGKMKKLVEGKHRGKVRLFFRHMPLPNHAYARGAARAAVAAGLQGRFWEMHDAIFAHQQHLGEQLYLEAAYDLGLDVLKFEKDMRHSRTELTIAQDVEQARQYGITGTPTFLVNGRVVQGNLPLKDFDKAIQEALKEVQQARSIR